MKINYQRMIQAVSLLVISCAFLWGCSFLNDYQDSGEKVYWWFSDEAIQGHTQTTLVLNPS